MGAWWGYVENGKDNGNCYIMMGFGSLRVSVLRV